MTDPVPTEDDETPGAAATPASDAPRPPETALLEAVALETAPLEAVALETVAPRPLLAVAYGLLAAAVAAFGWFLASIGTQSQLVYLAVAVGIAVGYFVNVGARRGSVLTSALAVVITLAGCTAGFYFVSRSSLIRRGYVQLIGNDTRIPLRPSYRLVRDVLRANLRSNVAPYIYVVVAMVVAAYFGLRGLDATKRRTER